MKNLRYIIQEAEQSKLQKEYEEYFTKLLDKYGVKSPADLSEEEKKKFFDEVQKGWTKGTGAKATNESKDEEEEDEKVEDVDPKVKKDGDTAKDAHKEMEEEEEEEVNESIINEEEKKLLSVNPQIGKAKYSFDYYDGTATHKDGSPFIGIVTAKNKKDFQKHIVDFIEKGYEVVNNVYSAIKESEEVNEEDSELQKEYESYFKGKLKEYGVGSPDELSEEEKKKFFDDVNKGWDNGKGEK